MLQGKSHFHIKIQRAETSPHLLQFYREDTALQLLNSQLHRVKKVNQADSIYILSVSSVAKKEFVAEVEVDFSTQVSPLDFIQSLYDELDKTNDKA